MEVVRKAPWVHTPFAAGDPPDFPPSVVSHFVSYSIPSALTLDAHSVCTQGTLLNHRLIFSY